MSSAATYRPETRCKPLTPVRQAAVRVIPQVPSRTIQQRVNGETPAKPLCVSPEAARPMASYEDWDTPSMTDTRHTTRSPPLTQPTTPVRYEKPVPPLRPTCPSSPAEIGALPPTGSSMSFHDWPSPRGPERRASSKHPVTRDRSAAPKTPRHTPPRDRRALLPSSQNVTPEQHKQIVRAFQAAQSSPTSAFRPSRASQNAVKSMLPIQHTPFQGSSPKSAHRNKKVTLTPGGWIRRSMALSQMDHDSTTHHTRAPSTIATTSVGQARSTFKKPKKAFQYDRFMPDRASIDLESAARQMYRSSQSYHDDEDTIHGNMTSSSIGSRHTNSFAFESESTTSMSYHAAAPLPSADLSLDGSLTRSTNTSSTAMDARALSYQYQVAQACGVAFDKRILSFTDHEIEERTTQQQHASSRVRILREKYNRPLRATTRVGVRRRLPTAPDKILDAPNVLDDFYLNVLDWSSSNIVAIGLNDTVYLWNALTGAVDELCSFESETAASQVNDGTGQQSSSASRNTIAGLSWAADGCNLAISGANGVTQIWDVEARSKIRTLRSHTHRVATLAWNDSILNTGDQAGQIGSSDVRIKNALIGMIRNHASEITSLKWSADLKSLASGGNDGKVCIWDINGLQGGSASETIRGRPRVVRRQHQAAVKALAWCPWQPSLLATGGGRLDRQICFWNSVNGNLLSSHQTSSQVTGLLWSPHYREIISSHGYATATVADTTADAEELGNHLTLWKYPTMTRIADMPHAHNARILHMATAPEGETIATLAADENLKFWKTWSRDGGKIKKGKSDADYHMSSNGQASNIQNTHASGGASRCASELPDKSPEFLGRFGKMQIR